MTGVRRSYFRALTIAGSDSGGGAGIQADLKTFSALGCYGLSVVTALTAQNTLGVQTIHEVPSQFVVEQMRAVLGDIGADAVKIGMLHDPEVIRGVARELLEFDPLRVVVDPVMVAKSGDRLLKEEAVQALREELLPQATVLTPNLPEAGALLGRPVNQKNEMEPAARDLCALGPQAVVVKGGHLSDGSSDDCLVVQGREKAVWLEQPRIPTDNVHGTGCTFSSAVAAGLARSMAIVPAVREAKQYLTEALTAGADFRLGRGRGPVHHFYRTWRPAS